LGEILTELGAVAVTLENGGPDEFYDTAFPQQPDWSELDVTGLFDGSVEPRAIVDEVSSVFPGCDCRDVSCLQDQDWERSWLSGLEPTQVGRDFWVCPSWLSPPGAKAVNLIIDPGLAFGTGTHPTTALCLEWLDGNRPEGFHVVDVGCGSGILAIAAIKLGAVHAWGIDIDPRALTASFDNAKRNGVVDEFTACTLDELPNGFSAQLVMANILASVLIELKERLVALVHTGGVILLTGILYDQAQDVQNDFASRFEFSETRRDEWSLLIGKKR
jgi:ribosomal protein L11 methyltransferase